MIKWIRTLRIGMLHAKYHRNMKRMEQARKKLDVIKFKTYAYRAEDAWRKLVILTENIKQPNG